MIHVNYGRLELNGNGLEILTDITTVVGFVAETMCEKDPSCTFEKALQAIIEPVHSTLIKNPPPKLNKEDTEGK